ncbi:MAG: hypothetical protein EOO48_02135 [Flavobacterium sp.]|nr:MAG: hypothetical protein EOO48_02135 [Flavobacterium sp.]
MKYFNAMENIFNPGYREDYIKGYETGFDPYSIIEMYDHSEGFISGFNFGRMDYESMNGYIVAGIPDRIVTKKTLEDFLLAGMLGFDIDADGYTTFQLDVIQIWYKSGIEKYNPEQGDYLSSVLENEGIEVG